MANCFLSIFCLIQPLYVTVKMPWIRVGVRVTFYPHYILFVTFCPYNILSVTFSPNTVLRPLPISFSVLLEKFSLNPVAVFVESMLCTFWHDLSLLENVPLWFVDTRNCFNWETSMPTCGWSSSEAALTTRRRSNRRVSLSQTVGFLPLLTIFTVISQSFDLFRCRRLVYLTEPMMRSCLCRLKKVCRSPT